MRKIYLENYTVSYCGEKVEITGTVNFVEYAKRNIRPFELVAVEYENKDSEIIETNLFLCLGNSKMLLVDDDWSNMYGYQLDLESLRNAWQFVLDLRRPEDYLKYIDTTSYDNGTKPEELVIRIYHNVEVAEK